MDVCLFLFLYGCLFISMDVCLFLLCLFISVYFQLMNERRQSAREWEIMPIGMV